MERANSASMEIADRQDAVQRGRQAMELITRQLRSQVCLGESAEPISYGDGSTITFYADLSDGTTNVQRRTLTFVAPSGSTPGRIDEAVHTGEGIYPELTFDETPDSSRALISRVQQVSVSGTPQPVFRYFAFQPGSPTGDLQELTTPLSATDASRTVMVRIAFVSLPDAESAARARLDHLAERRLRPPRRSDTTAGGPAMPVIDRLRTLLADGQRGFTTVT